MSDTVAAYSGPGATWRDGGAAAARWEPPDARRRLQLALAAIWLLDAVLQYQSFMFTRTFARMLAASADGNPVIVAAPITWSARIIGQHAVAANSVFATVQLLLALGIALRPTIKIALGASVAWSLAVWWLGEGLGSALAGNASPVSGAPGAVIIYALQGQCGERAGPARLPAGGRHDRHGGLLHDQAGRGPAPASADRA